MVKVELKFPSLLNGGMDTYKITLDENKKVYTIVGNRTCDLLREVYGIFNSILNGIESISVSSNVNIIISNDTKQKVFKADDSDIYIEFTTKRLTVAEIARINHTIVLMNNNFRLFDDMLEFFYSDLSKGVLLYNKGFRKNIKALEYSSESEYAVSNRLTKTRETGSVRLWKVMDIMFGLDNNDKEGQLIALGLVMTHDKVADKYKKYYDLSYDIMRRLACETYL